MLVRHMVNRGLIDIRPVKKKEKQDPCWSRGRIELSNMTGAYLDDVGETPILRGQY